MTKVIVKAADGTGAVELFHDAAKKLETSSAGVTITGEATAGNISLPDDGELKLGNGDDLKLYHDASKSVIADTGTGGLYVAGSSVSLTNAGITETMLYAAPDGAVELYYDNSKKLATASGGVDVTGRLTATDISLPDDGELKLGDADDLKIFHDGSHSIIRDTGTGSLMLQGSSVIMESPDGGEVQAKFIDDGAVELYHDNSKKIETIATGVNVTGGIRLGGNNAVNELSDYEEGTWTLSLGGTSSNPTYNVLTNVGHYIKIGRLCTFSCRITFNNWVDGSGALQFKGLPFASKNTANFYTGNIFITYADGFEAATGGQVPYSGSVPPNTTTVYVTQSDTNTTSITSDQVTTSYTNEWMISGHYHTES